MNAGQFGRWPQLIAAFDALWREPARAGEMALCDEFEAYTYAELHCAVGQSAGWLREQGVREGDRIAIAMERSAHMAVTVLGAMAAGACPCPLEPLLGTEELSRRTRMARLNWLVADAPHSHVGRQCGLPPGRCLQYTGDKPPQEGGWHTGIDPQSAGYLLFTSGSSGLPKGVLQNHRGMLNNALGVAAHTGLGPGDRLLHIMPLHHTNGVNNQLLTPLLAGSSVVLAPRFKAEDMPELFEQHRPTIVTGVPTMYSRMLSCDFSAASLQNLRMLRCGSAPITEELHRRIEAKFGLPLVVSYGLSEATCTSTMNPPQARRIGSVGTPLQGQSVFLRNAQGETLASPGAEGEICIAGPSLMTGYLLDGADGTPEPAGPLLRTGDLGRFDDDGYLYITGRLKDVIIRGGENLSPNLIEEAIAAVPGVAACCVVGKPHADLGEVPVAFVVRQGGDGRTQALSELIAKAVGSRLSRIHQPSEIFFADALPENAMGKVDRSELRRLACRPGDTEGLQR